MKPHKHAELIKAWADGAEIQDRYKFGYRYWTDWADNDEPTWQFDHEYRIKPEPKPDVVMYMGFELNQESSGEYVITTTIPWASNKPKTSSNLKLIFDGETGKLKDAEVLK